MIDTHTHLYLAEFDDPTAADPSSGRGAAVERAVAAGVDMMVFPNVDLGTIAPMRALSALYPSHTRMAMGLHPTEVRETWRDDLGQVLDELHAHAADYCAVGEVGIDLYWDRTFEREQMEVLDLQAREASALGLPMIIHCREGLDHALEVLQGHPGVRCVFHSFGGTTADVERIRRTGHGDHYFGINGIVTFKNSGLRSVLPAIGAERILTETDSPYLAPVPHRGKRNESAYIPLIVEAIAAATGRSAAEISALTTANAKSFFNL